jgi:Spy/CpxP family protein refolding chaperone
MINPQTKRQARLWLALVFFLGAGIGVAFGYAFAHKSYASTNGPSMSEPVRRARRVADMTQAIGLTPEQSQKLDGIILSAHEEMKKTREQSDKDIDAIREKARAQMREFLTPEQKVKFEEFIRKTDAERKRMAAEQGPK